MRLRVRVTAIIAAAVGSVVACGSSEESLFDNGENDGGALVDGSLDPGEGGGGFIEEDAARPLGNCRPRTCEEADVGCGPTGDGCGGLIQCGTCNLPDTCGGGGVPSKCGGGIECTPKTCEDLGATCGPVGDGCGGVLDCGACTAPQTCGGGGTPSVCGGNSGCIPKDCANAGPGGTALNCGLIGDGCGGIKECGTCPPSQSCGGGGTPSVCGGTVTDGGVSNCVPRTTCPANSCGPVADGCGGVIQCGGCTPPQTCGGGGTASRCGGTSACIPRNCAGANANCGPVGDGCGNLLNCGTCTLPQTCGGGGTASRCGGNTVVCQPLTQCPANACGPIANGCGGSLNCGGCAAPDICGGGGVPSQCGGGTTGLPDAGCTGLCAQQVRCPSPGAADRTIVRGKVYAPNGVTPLYNAVVYVPNGTVQPFGQGVSCQQCGSEVSGDPLVKAWTGPDGSFTLTNVPAGTNIPLVIQMGRWRRFVRIPTVTACQTLNMDSNATLRGLTRFPRVHEEGNSLDNIPLTAISTGGVDALECLLRKIGIRDNQFCRGTDNATCRIQMFQGNEIDRGPNRTNYLGARPPSGNAVPEANLFTGTPQHQIRKYDQVFFACEGDEVSQTNGQKDALIAYANAGGRVFATHYSYAWLFNRGTFAQTATWAPESASGSSQLYRIDRSFPKGDSFALWLQNVGALAQETPFFGVTINDWRQDFTAVTAPAQRWLYNNGTPARIGHYTFNTPWGVDAEQQCGRVVFSDFHVTGRSANNARFPTGQSTTSYCGDPNAELTAQEKVLLFMLFDLGSCIEPDQPPPPPTCTRRTCTQAGANCGPVGDGCGGVLDCGTCPSPQTCGGGGTPSVCGGSSCPPQTCPANACGPIGNGCGGQLDCGDCPEGQTCGGGGTQFRCGNPSCTKLTCQMAGANCGPVGDGCGGLLDCGDCPEGQTCGGGGSPSICGNSNCVPRSCASVGATCGPIADGCGGIVQCGTCQPGQICGGGGQANTCAPGSCTPRTCAQVGATCGPIGDGCGGIVPCGPCTVPGQSCGGGGTPSQCGGCRPLTCEQLGHQCGPSGDGCGGVVDCGDCVAPDTCGGSGTPFKCGRPGIR